MSCHLVYHRSKLALIVHQAEKKIFKKETSITVRVEINSDIVFVDSKLSPFKCWYTDC